MPTFPEVRVGSPLEYEALAVFPLFVAPTQSEDYVQSEDGTRWATTSMSQQPHGVDYLLSDEAIGGGAITVEEVSEGGSVPNLVVDNRAGTLVLFLEGEELRGAKQNRVLNASVLVAAGKTMLPVSCVEQGRWHYRSRQFGSSGSHSSSKMRHILKKSVGASLHQGRGHGSDQRSVWQEVTRQMDSLGSTSMTGAMADTYASHEGRLSEFRDRLKYVEGAAGVAVAVGGKVASVDLFDKPATCRKVWGRLLSGVIMDALEARPGEKRAGGAEVGEILAALQNAPWKQSPAVGAGEEFRAEAGGERHASVLTYHGEVVHGSLVVAG
jgi:hypothetical protein